MSEMLGRTWNYISWSVSSESRLKWTCPRNLRDKSGDLPRGLANFLDSLVSESENTPDLLNSQISLVKAKLDEPDLKGWVIADCVLRMVVADLYGADVEFSQIHAIKLAQRGKTLLLRKVGYLSSVLLLKPGNELNFHLVNTIIKDLESKNPIEINFALCASSSHLVPEEVIPLLLPSLIAKTTHIKDFIRKKALAALHRLLKRKPDLATSIEGPVRHCLTDSDPGVVAGAVQLTKDLIHKTDMSDIFPGILGIAGQILDGKFPKEYEFRGISAPWMMCDVISLASVLRSGYLKKISDESNRHYILMLKRVLHRTIQSKELVGHAITFECIRAVSLLRSEEDAEIKTEMISKLLPCVSRLLQDKNSNLKYAGISGMELLFKDSNIQLTSDQEKTIVACLNFQDETVRRKTLGLLYVLAHKENVQQICDTLLRHIKEIEDRYKRNDLIEKASDLAEKFRDSVGLDWYVNVLLRLSQVSCNDKKHKFILLIKSKLYPLNSHGEERLHVGIKLKHILDQFLSGDFRKISKSMTTLYIWCWAHFEPKLSELTYILDIATKANRRETVLDAIFDIFIANPLHPPLSQEAKDFVLGCANENEDERIQDKAYEIISVMNVLEGESFSNVKKFTEEEEVDFTLSYLDGYILEEVDKRQISPYNPILSLLDKSLYENPEKDDDEEPKLRLSSYNEIPTTITRSSTSSSNFGTRDVKLEEEVVWSLEGRKEDKALSKKRSDSIESFVVEDCNRSYGLDSFMKENILPSEEE